MAGLVRKARTDFKTEIEFVRRRTECTGSITEEAILCLRSRTATNRLRGRYGEAITSEIARTVASAEEIPGERRYILEVLCSANASPRQN